LAEAWIRQRVEPVAAIEMVHERPWATVLRVPLADGVAWFKACAPIQAFEPRLTAALSARWPDRVGEVLAHDEQRGWLLLADAGTPLFTLGNPPEAWLAVLPRYAELQRGEATFATDHVANHVPELRLATLPARYVDLLQHELPLEPDEIGQLRGFETRFSDLCEELAAHNVPETIQHDDLHGANVFSRHGHLRVLDWGDASIAHPFTSLLVTFRFLDEINHLMPSDGWFARLRDAYLEPWGRDMLATFELAMRVGAFAHAIAWGRQRDALTEPERPEFDRAFTTILRLAVCRAASFA
jgi:Phosphotransferase enzyme family